MKNKKPHNSPSLNNGILPTDTDSATCAKCKEMQDKMKKQNIESNNNFTIKCFDCIKKQLCTL